MCPNKVKGATTVNVTWNYSESAGSAVAAALEAEVSFLKIFLHIFIARFPKLRYIEVLNLLSIHRQMRKVA